MFISIRQFRATLIAFWTRLIMVTSLFTLSVLNTEIVFSQNIYYIDSHNGNDHNNGLSENAPWKSHTMVESADLQPGDSVRFARGSAWLGAIQINQSGSEGKPITLTHYGSGELPKFSNPNWSDNTGNAIRFAGDYLIADGLYLHDVPPPPSGGFITVWSAGALRILLGADHCIIRNCYFDTVPKAIQSHGEYTLITHNTMIGEQVLLGSKYWGPIGIQLGIGNQEICYNTIREFWVTEGHAWGGDGGAMEMDDGRNHKDNVYIHHNRTINNCGFLEISWDYDIEHREVWNLRVAFNVSTDFQSIGFLEAPLHDSYIDNNTFDRTHQLHFNSSMEVQLGNPIVRNNLIIVDGVSPYRADDGQLHVTPQNNWYYQVNNPDRIYFPESAAGNGNPGLVHFVSGGVSDYHLSENSPLRGAAQNLSEFYSGDFEGNALPVEGPWDVGAYQTSQTKGFVSIQSPSAGEVFYVPSEITIDAVVDMSEGSISKVSFYNGSNKLGEDNSSPYTYQWSVDQVGIYLLKVIASTDDGLQIGSRPVWILVTDTGGGKEIIWHSYDVKMNTGFQPAIVLDQNGKTPATVELYQSVKDGSVDQGKLFTGFNSGQHLESFNRVEDFWAHSTGKNGYPYAGKSSVDRGSDVGESNVPAPLGVRDLQMHPPPTDKMTVAAFMAPFDGKYAVSDLAVRRLQRHGRTVTYRVFDASMNPIAALTGLNDRAWVTDEKTYELGILAAGARIYFAVDKGEDDSFDLDATEIVWTVTFDGNASHLGEKQDSLSKHFAIEQNYPNPFNSDTAINFHVPKTERVSINVYDILGQNIRTLLNNNMRPGQHRIKWNGRNDKGDVSPSGIYFYKIKAGSYQSVKRLLFMK